MKPGKQKRSRGQPTSYKDSYVNQAYCVCKESGYTIPQLAELFGVVERTVERWKNEYPEFCHAIKTGRWEFDNVKVEASLLKRALGYDYEETKRVTEQVTDASGTAVGKVRQRIEKISKSIPPDPACLFFWLCNRQGQDWKNLNRIIIKGSDSDLNDLNTLTTKELMGIIKSNGNGNGKKKKKD